MNKRIDKNKFSQSVLFADTGMTEEEKNASHKKNNPRKIVLSITRLTV